MALVTISGYPAAGKSLRAAQLSDALQERIKAADYTGPLSQVTVLSDNTLNISRSTYDDSRTEKPARGNLFTAVQRRMASDTVLIVDSLNYIKGFRYQLYCAAREMKLRVCTVYVVATPEMCRGWNNHRENDMRYSAETLENLLLRYEEPNSMVRWDSPLFTVLWSDERLPLDNIWTAITKGTVKPPNSGTLAAVKAPTDALHTLEQTTSAVVSTIMSSQTGLGGKLSLRICGTLKMQINLPPHNVSLAELQKLKRQFVTVHKRAITLGTRGKGDVNWAEEQIASKFVTYLEENIKT